MPATDRVLVGSDANRALAARAVAESAVLLRHDGRPPAAGRGRESRPVAARRRRRRRHGHPARRLVDHLAGRRRGRSRPGTTLRGALEDRLGTRVVRPAARSTRARTQGRDRRRGRAAVRRGPGRQRDARPARRPSSPSSTGSARSWIGSSSWSTAAARCSSTGWPPPMRSSRPGCRARRRRGLADGAARRRARSRARRPTRGRARPTMPREPARSRATAPYSRSGYGLAGGRPRTIADPPPRRRRVDWPGPGPSPAGNTRGGTLPPSRRRPRGVGPGRPRSERGTVRAARERRARRSLASRAAGAR